jgi:bifunctional oligoribonuclease and PAP phosphatase NrnA
VIAELAISGREIDDAVMTIHWDPLRPILADHQRYVISSHVRPDADAIGSEIGLARVLQSLGKSVQIINTSPTPPNLFFLDPQREVKQLGAGATAEDVAAAEVHFVVDTSSWTQLSDVGKLMKESNALRVVIDHHASADDLGATEFKDVQSEATGSLIFDLSQALGVDLPTDAANSLFAAIATDTGWFRFAAVTSNTMRIIARLMEFGAKPADIFRELYEQSSIARMHLVGRALAGMTLACNGELAYITVPWSDFKETGAISSDTEDLVNECLKVVGTRGAFIAIELQNGQVKVSFRSRAAGLDVAKIAEQFGGGGHRQAAGATLPGPLPQAVARALEAMTMVATTLHAPAAKDSGP